MQGTSYESTDLSAVYVAAFVKESVFVIAPFGWGAVPVQSATSESPRFLNVTKRSG